MPLKPDVETFLANAAPYSFAPAAATDAAVATTYLTGLRRGVARTGEPEHVDRVSEHQVNDDVRVRVYAPRTDGPAPVLVYFHGGGWVSGDLDMHDATCRGLANGAPCVVVNVDYRLAPEHPFPTPLDDCYAATVWAHEHAAELGGDSGRLGVGGSSAGGNLAAAVCLKARAGGGPPLVQQVLIYPVLDAAMTTPSQQANGQGYFLTTEQMRWFWDQYTPDPSMRSDPLASPANEERLEGLPPAVVLVAEYDPLRDEGEQYAERLERAGVPVRLLSYDGQIHGFIALANMIADGARAVGELADVVGEMFAGG